jgi:hypothetical protein
LSNEIGYEGGVLGHQDDKKNGQADGHNQGRNCEREEEQSACVADGLLVATISIVRGSSSSVTESIEHKGQYDRLWTYTRISFSGSSCALMLLESDILFCLVADAGFFVAKVDGVEGRNPRKYARRVYAFMPSSGNRAGFLSVISLLVDIIFVRHTS